MRASDLNAATQTKLFPGLKLGKQRTAVSQESTFAFQCRAYKLPDVTAQYRFAQSAYPTNARRRWIADFAFLELKVMIEIDGGLHIPGMGHSRATGIERSMTKQNDAALLGFVTLRFTPKEVKSGHAIAFTQRILHTRGKP